MLLNLHVKNLALIEEAEVDFHEGLNIMTGETGAGKSIIIGSINIALGGRFLKILSEMVRITRWWNLYLTQNQRKYKSFSRKTTLHGKTVR